MMLAFPLTLNVSAWFCARGWKVVDAPVAVQRTHPTDRIPLMHTVLSMTHATCALTLDVWWGSIESGRATWHAVYQADALDTEPYVLARTVSTCPIQAPRTELAPWIVWCGLMQYRRV